MKLISYKLNEIRSYGLVTGEGVIDLGRRLPHHSLLAALKADALEDIRSLAEASPDHRLADVTLLTPLPDAANLICIGRNYKGHVAETNLKLPDFPSTFIRLPSSIVAHEEALVRPRISSDFDYEGELAVVIGKGGRHIRAEDAFSHVAGYSIVMDGSIRDYQMGHCLVVGKNFFATGSFGPWLVTADEVGDPTELFLSTRLNGVEVQRTQTNDLIFDIPYLISYISNWMPLSPGDVISTGTPEGVGFTRKPPLWLKPGDSLEVEISRLGVLRNTVIAE